MRTTRRCSSIHRLVAIGLLWSLGCGVLRAADPPATVEYPATRRTKDADTYHAVEISDPYRWLENLDSAETQAWVTAQRRITDDFLARLSIRSTLHARLRELWNIPRYGLPQAGGKSLYFQRVDGLQPQPILYAIDALDATPRVIIDPNQLDARGTTSICAWSVSPNGRWLAYALAEAGSDLHEWRIRDLNASRDLPDRLATTLYNEVHWSPRSDGFYYARSSIPTAARKRDLTPERMLRIRFHPVGQKGATERTLFEQPAQRDAMCDVRLSNDGRWLIARMWQGLERDRRVFCLDLNQSNPAPQWLVPRATAHFQFVTAQGDEFLFQTDHEAPRGRIVAIDRRRVAPEHWRDVVAPTADVLLETTCVSDRLFVKALRDAQTVVDMVDLTGRRCGSVNLEVPGTVSGFRAAYVSDDGTWETFYSVTNDTQPPRLFRFDPAAARSHAFHPVRLPYDPARYKTEYLSYASADGTQIPLRVTRRVDTMLTPQTPVMLYGYGGFQMPLTPSFSPTHLAWLDLGGVLAVPHIRGGGEFGRTWHEAARGPAKGVAVDDFLAAAQWLVDQKYTSPQRLTIRGVSNGGLIAAAALTRRPELFAAAVPAVAPLDMLRYHRMPRGWSWLHEYGTADNADHFSALRAYSPLHNLRPETRYPATLIMTSEQDDRVVPAHSFKFAAALQAVQAGPAPCLIRVESQAGHGAGTATPKLVDAGADVLAFLCHVLRLNP